MQRITAAIQWVLLTWFVAVNLFILVPSYFLLKQVVVAETTAGPTQPGPPAPPGAPELLPFDRTLEKEVQGKLIESRVNAYTQSVNGYQHSVTAYNHQLGAYKAQLEAGAKSQRLSLYQTVVKDTLVSMLTTLLTALVGYVFVRGGAEAAKEYFKAKAAKAQAEEARARAHNP